MMTRPGLPSLATLAAAALLATAPAMADPPAHAKAWGHPSRQAYDADYRDYRHRDCDRDDRYGDRYRYDRDRYRDHHHDRYDPVRTVYVIERLPRGYRHVDYRGDRYYYHRDGGWYRPYGAAYVQVAPPAGLVIDSRGIAVVANVPIVRW